MVEKVKAVKNFKTVKFKKNGSVRSEIRSTATACCSDFVPYSYCKRRFELSHGQKYVKDRIKKDIVDIGKVKPEMIPRVLVDHEVGSGKSELAIQLVNDHLKKGQHAIVACPDSDNINTWQKEIFKDRGGEAIYKHWNFHPKNLDEKDFSSSRTLRGIYKSQWEKYSQSRRQIPNERKLGTFYLDTHDFVFRSLCALNDHSEKWPKATEKFFAQSVHDIPESSNKKRKKTLKDQIRFHTKNFLIVVDECHQCIDSTKQKDGNYKYVNSLALLGMLMFAHDTCKIVLMTATALHVSGVGGVGALVYTLYPQGRKAKMRRPTSSHFAALKGKLTTEQKQEEKPVLTKINSFEDDDDDENDENNDDEENNGHVDNVGGISNENFAKKFLNKQASRDVEPVATLILTQSLTKKELPIELSKFSLNTFSRMIGENTSETKTNFLHSIGNNGKMKGQKHFEYATIFAEVTVDCIDYFNNIYNIAKKLIVTDEYHGVTGFISHWSTAKDASLYPKASLSTCNITSRNFEFDKPCVYPLEVPFAPIHNIMMQPRKRALTNIKVVHDIITREDTNTNKGTLNQEQRLLGLLQGRQQTMISKLCKSDMSTSSANTNDSKFKCFSYGKDNLRSKTKANVVKTIVMDVFNHLDKVELKKPKKGSKTQEWVKKGSSISVIPTSLQSYKDIILNEPLEKPVVWKVSTSQTPQQTQKAIKIRKQTIEAKKKELTQIKRNIAETEGKLAPGASKAVSKSKKSVTTTGRKRKAPARLQSISKATLTKKTRAQLQKDYKKQIQMRNKTEEEIRKLETTPIVNSDITRELSTKKLTLKGQIEFYNKELENAKGTEAQKQDLEKLYSEELVKTGISFLNRLDGIFKKSNNVRLIDAKIRQESRKKFVKIRNDLFKMETGITALSMAGLAATVSVNGKTALVGQPLSIYGKDETNPVFFRRPGNVLPMFSLFSTANLMLANIIRSTSNQVNKSTSPYIKRKGSVRVTLPEDKSKGNVMVYVDSAARSEGNELCHLLVNQASCIQLESGLHEDTSSIFAVTGVSKIIDGKESQATTPSSLSREIKHKKVDGPIFEFNTGKLYDTKGGNNKPEIEVWLKAIDKYIADVQNLIKKTFGPLGDKRVEFLLRNEDPGHKSISISASDITTRKKKSSNYFHDKDTIAYHNPVMSLLYSLFQHISSEEAISHVENELSMSMTKLDWKQPYRNNQTYEIVLQKKLEDAKNTISFIRQDLFQKIRSVRGHIDKKLKTPVFFRYFVSKQKSVTKPGTKTVHLLNKPSKSILEKIYNIPENNTGDLCNAIISEMTHGGSMFNTPYMVLYHKQQKRQPISNAQRKQIYGRNARNCSMFLRPQNMIKRIDLKTTNSSFFGNGNMFVEPSNSPSPSPVKHTSPSPSLSKGNEESPNVSPSVNSKSTSANRSKNNTTNNNNTNNKPNNKPNEPNKPNKPNLTPSGKSIVTTPRTRKAFNGTNPKPNALSPAKTIPSGVQTFGIRIAKATDTAPLRHFSTYMGYDPDLFPNCGNTCNLTQHLYTFASKVCNANTTGVLLGQSKVMTDSVRELLHCDRDRRLNTYNSNSEVNKLKSHQGMMSTEQNLIFENMRKKAANAEIFKNYIRGESAANTENNTIKEKGGNAPQNTKGTKLIKYKFAVHLIRTGLYDHWLQFIQKEKKYTDANVIKDFTKIALDAKIPPSRIKSDLTKKEEYLSFKKSLKKQKVGMDYGTFVAHTNNTNQGKNINNKLKLSTGKDSKEQILALLGIFVNKANKTTKFTTVQHAGWKELYQTKDGKTYLEGKLQKNDQTLTYDVKKMSSTKFLLNYLLEEKNSLDENEQKFVRDKGGMRFFVLAKPVTPAYLRKIPILVKENIGGNAEKALAAAKLVNIKRRFKPKPKSIPKTKVSKVQTPDTPQKPQDEKITKALTAPAGADLFFTNTPKGPKFSVWLGGKFYPKDGVLVKHYESTLGSCYNKLLKNGTKRMKIIVKNGQTQCIIK